MERARFAPEHRCAPYDSDDYPYPQSVELKIIESLGGRIYGPYTGRHFSNRRQTDIEHIVARSEAHDSGLCAANARTRRAFSRDLLNLTLAAPEINRCGAGADALALWDDNRNGRITCAEARAHGIAPVQRGHPAYPFMHDADDDGVVCE